MDGLELQNIVTDVVDQFRGTLPTLETKNAMLARAEELVKQRCADEPPKVVGVKLGADNSVTFTFSDHFGVTKNVFLMPTTYFI